MAPGAYLCSKQSLAARPTSYSPSDATLLAYISVQDVNPDDFGVLADNAMKDACGLTNPRQPTRDDVIEILRKAYEQ